MTLREFSAGGVVYKRQKGEILWLVTKSSFSKLFKQIWRLPKGWLDNEKKDIPGPMASGKIKADEKSLQETALREVAEESGVKAKIVQKLEIIRYIYKHPTRGRIFKFVTFYLMEYTKDLPEGFDDETEEIAWLKYEDAYKLLANSGEKKVLKKAHELLASSA